MLQRHYQSLQAEHPEFAVVPTHDLVPKSDAWSLKPVYRGKRTRTWVPWPGAEDTVQEAPISWARSFMPASP